MQRVNLFPFFSALALVTSVACSTTYSPNALETHSPQDTASRPSTAQDAAANPCGAVLAYDKQNCGACGKVCPTPANAREALCNNATCFVQCERGYHPTTAGDTCEPNVTEGCGDTTTSNDNCGSCRVACVKPSNAASATCVASECVPTCDAQFVRDGNFCKPSAVAVSDSGTSTPRDSGTPSDSAVYTDAGACGGTDLNTDPNNCGACGNVCNPSSGSYGGSRTCARYGGTGTCGFLCLRDYWVDPSKVDGQCEPCQTNQHYTDPWGNVCNGGGPAELARRAGCPRL